MIYRGVNIFIKHRTEGRLADEVSWMIRKVDVVDLCEYEVGDWGGEGDGPAEDADDGGPLDVWEGEDVERGADGEVALQGEREDRQHGGVRGAAQYDEIDDIKQQTFKLNMYTYVPFGQKRSNLTKVFPERIRVLMPIN